MKRTLTKEQLSCLRESGFWFQNDPAAAITEHWHNWISCNLDSDYMYQTNTPTGASWAIPLVWMLSQLYELSPSVVFNAMCKCASAVITLLVSHNQTYISEPDATSAMQNLLDHLHTIAERKQGAQA